MGMKRTRLLVDPHLLDEARRILGVKTYSATVNLALHEVTRVQKVRSLADFFGKGLSAMREDRVRKRNRN